jgi:hypothetical protein
MGVRGGGGEEPNHTTARKPGPLINHSTLSVFRASSHDTNKHAHLPARKLVNLEAFVRLVRFIFDIDLISLTLLYYIYRHDRTGEEYSEQ